MLKDAGDYCFVNCLHLFTTKDKLELYKKVMRK